MFYEGINTKVFRRSIAFAIALVVTSRSSSFVYTMSVHAVHAGAERNVCNIVVSTETAQTTTNPSQEKTFFGAHASDPTAFVHVDTASNTKS